MPQIKGSYATCIASDNPADDAFSIGTSIAIGTAIANESAYALLDFRVNVTVGTPLAGGKIAIYRRAGDGTNNAPAPTVSYLRKSVGKVELDTSTGFYYLYGVPNPDPNDRYYAMNEGGATLTFIVAVRGRDYA